MILSLSRRLSPPPARMPDEKACLLLAARPERIGRIIFGRLAGPVVRGPKPVAWAVRAAAPDRGGRAMRQADFKPAKFGTGFGIAASRPAMEPKPIAGHIAPIEAAHGQMLRGAGRPQAEPFVPVLARRRGRWPCPRKPCPPAPAWHRRGASAQGATESVRRNRLRRHPGSPPRDCRVRRHGLGAWHLYRWPRSARQSSVEAWRRSVSIATAGNRDAARAWRSPLANVDRGGDADRMNRLGLLAYGAAIECVALLVAREVIEPSVYLYQNHPADRVRSA